MANSRDVDTKETVSKYLSRQTTATRLDPSADTSEEIKAVLESIAISLLLNPQAALVIILRAKNTLQQLISADLEIVDFIIDSIREISNPNDAVSDTSDLVEAQTALVELDRIGKISTDFPAYERYESAIVRFMDNQLARSLKRQGTGEFERSGAEAKQDLFDAISLFTKTHQLLSTRIREFASSVDDFNSVDLSKIAHRQTLTRVRSAISQIKTGMDDSSLSKTVAAVELLAGSSALQSISDLRGLYDVVLKTGVEPVGNVIQLCPEPTRAFKHSLETDLLVSASTPWIVTIGSDGDSPISNELPHSGKSGRPFIFNTTKEPYAIPSGYKLYINVTPGPSPGSDGVTHYEVPLTSGSRSAAQVIANINAVLPSGSATDFDNPLGYVMVFGGSSDTEIEILESGPGDFSSPPTYTPADPSAHSILGFRSNQISDAIGTFRPEFISLFLNSLISDLVIEIEDGVLFVQSGSTDPAVSQLVFSGAVLVDLGFPSTTIDAVPLAMLLSTEGVTLEPTSLGLIVGSVIRAPLFEEPVASFDGNRILFDSSVVLPKTQSDVTVDDPSVYAVKNAVTIANLVELDSDLLAVQQVLSPLLASPTLAQINDAQRIFALIKDKLTSFLSSLSSIVVTEAQQPQSVAATTILHTLEERGLDRAFDLMSRCLFSEFFALTEEVSSKSSRFLKSMEEVVRKDFPTSTVESDMPDGNTLSGSNSRTILTDKEVP